MTVLIPGSKIFGKTVELVFVILRKIPAEFKKSTLKVCVFLCDICLILLHLIYIIYNIYVIWGGIFIFNLFFLYLFRNIVEIC